MGINGLHFVMKANIKDSANKPLYRGNECV